jgi:uncharacterized protein (DUF488 family)
MIRAFGYAGRTLDEIAALLGESGRLLDIRLSPQSRNPAMCRGNLRQRFGERYRHVPALGNRRYRDGPPVEIANFDLGRAIVAEEQLAGDVFLMCCCRDARSCHRSDVARMLREVGFDVEEVR